MAFTLTFLHLFFWSIYLVSPLLLLFGMVIVILGQIVRHLEKWGKFDALYWSFITATTVGYGDFRPLRKASRIISVFIALTGIMFTGLILSVTLRSATIALDTHLDPDIVNKMKSRIESQN